MNLLFSVFGVFVALFSVANGKKEKCLGSSLLEAKHFKFLPDLKRQDTVIKGENYCNLKDENSCCTEHELDTVKGWFVLADYYLSMEEYMNERLMKHPDDLYFITLGIVSQVMETSGVKVNINDKMRAEIKRIIDSELKLSEKISDSVFTMANTVMSYAAGMTCSVCDPRASRYITSANDTLELLLNPKMCDEFVGGFEEIVEAISAMSKNDDFIDAIEDFVVSICNGVKSNDSVTCDKKYLKSMVENAVEEFFSEESIYEMTCVSKDECRKVLCEETFRGLGIDISVIKENIKTFLSVHCKKSMGCPADKILQVLDDLEKSVQDSMTEGKEIRNVFPSKKEHEETLDVWSIGCSSKLSSRVCKPSGHDKDDDDKHKFHGSSVAVVFGVLFIVGAVGAAGVIFYKRRNQNSIEDTGYREIGQNP